jgi:hypothetical protein
MEMKHDEAIDVQHNTPRPSGHHLTCKGPLALLQVPQDLLAQQVD